MKELKTDILLFAGLLILALIIGLFVVGQTALDIQLHDTCFMIDNISLAIVIVGPLTLLVFLARGLTRKFKTIGTNVGLAIGLILVAFITYHIIQLQHSYLTSMMQLDDEGLPDRGQFKADSKRRINWSWAIFSLWVTALILLIFRTMRIWKEGRNASF